jgi:hypothetical protein
MTVGELPSYQLNLEMVCECGHTALLAWNQISGRYHKPISAITGSCKACGAKGVRVNRAVQSFHV